MGNDLMMGFQTLLGPEEITLNTAFPPQGNGQK